MNQLLIIGEMILAKGPLVITETDIRSYIDGKADAVYPKQSIPGWQIMETDLPLPADFTCSGYSWVNGALVKNPDPMPPVPEFVDVLQCELVLAKYDELKLVQPAIDAISDPLQKRKFQAYWNRSARIYRNDPRTVYLGAAIGMSAETVDLRFIEAETIQEK